MIPAAPLRPEAAPLPSAQRIRRRIADAGVEMGACLSRRRRVLECCVSLTLIAVLSSLTAWVLWEAMVDRRVVIGSDPAAVADEGAATRQPSRGHTTIATPEVRRGAGAGAGVGSVRDSQPRVEGGQPASLPGPALGAAAAAGAVLVGSMAAMLVVRRYRRCDGPDDDLDQPRPEVAVVVPDLEDARDVLVDTAQDAVAVVELPHADPVDGAPAGRRAGVDEAQPGRHRGGDGVAGAGQPEPTAARHQVHEVGQRLFEKRKAPRIPFDGPGQLQWRDGGCAVRVVDLSEVGLRCRLAGTVTAGTAPRAPQTVLLAFPVGGGVVDVTARIAWRKVTSEGVDVGLEFTAMSDDSRELLGRTCAIASV